MQHLGWDSDMVLLQLFLVFLKLLCSWCTEIWMGLGSEAA